ncbi:MAG: FadR family transcriptional regulator [Acidimicrobiia bacterium]|nr:FadR family transcriptional regulator [Acidimicrobiia bacterium]
MQFTGVERSALPDAVTEQIRGAIIAGEVEPGSLLPSERELALQFGVNRTTIRESLQALELLGLVSRRQGVGARVLDFHETGSLDLLPYILLAEDGSFRHDASDGLLELTGIYYGLVVRNAARKATVDDIAELELLLSHAEAGLEEGTGDGIANSLLLFYRRLIRSSHSIVLELLGNSFEQLFASDAPSFDSVYADLAMRTLGGPRSPYRRLLDALAAHDAKAATKAIADLAEPLEIIVRGRSR